MSIDTQQVVSKDWAFAYVLRDYGLSLMAFVEQITFLLFFKIAGEQTNPPHNPRRSVPASYDRARHLDRPCDALETMNLPIVFCSVSGVGSGTANYDRYGVLSVRRQTLFLVSKANVITKNKV
jgi:hypothetical protein